MLDIELRIRVHALMTELEQLALPGVIDIVPGIRSLQLHFDGEVLDQRSALAALIAAEERLGDLEDFSIPSRIVHLPLSWRDPATIETIEKYMGAVRDDAPWCPDNIEFIRRINGLPDADAVENLIFDASYLVLGLGDVYLGAPVATPVDPRHRLVTTKYNPARTWTPPNVVGIGGAYMCIYGMEGPGGYQLFGRTIQVWNTHRQTDAFVDGKPWLLRFFDQIRFFQVERRGADRMAPRLSQRAAARSRSSSPNSAWPIIAPFWPRTPDRSRLSRRSARPPSTKSAPNGSAAANSTGSPDLDGGPTPAQLAGADRGARRRGPGRSAVRRQRVEAAGRAGRRGEGGRHDRGDRGDEDGMPAGKPGQRHGRGALHAGAAIAATRRADAGAEAAPMTALDRRGARRNRRRGERREDQRGRGGRGNARPPRRL